MPQINMRTSTNTQKKGKPSGPFCSTTNSAAAGCARVCAAPTAQGCVQHPEAKGDARNWGQECSLAAKRGDLRC